MQKVKADASCKSVLTIPKMKSGGSLLGGWKWLHKEKMHDLRKTQENTSITKIALLQALRIQSSQRAQHVLEYLGPDGLK